MKHELTPFSLAEARELRDAARRRQAEALAAGRRFLGGQKRDVGQAEHGVPVSLLALQAKLSRSSS